MLGDLARYVSLQDEAIDLMKLLSGKEEREVLPWILCRLAKGWDATGNSKRANPVLVDHVAIFRNREHKFGMPFSMLLLGENLLRLGKPQESEQFLTEALVLFEGNGQEGLLVDTMVALSRAAAALKNKEEARLYADQAVEEARRGPRKAEGLADMRHLNQALIQAARAYLDLGRKHESLAFYGEALDLASKSNRRLMLAEILDLQKSLIRTTP
jgi:tetratricopeptide (TPR) repeat protein